MNIENDVKLDFSDVLIKPKRSTLGSRSEVNLVRDFKPKYGTPFSAVPSVVANMATGSFDMLHEMKKNKMMVAIAKHNSYKWKDEFDKDQTILDYGFYTIGMNDDELDTLKLFHIYTGHKASLKICVDIANGYTQKFSDFVAKVRSEFPYCVIVAGNVATAEMTAELIISGADYVKIGIGPGSVCSTRRMTGIGVPQLSAVIECSESAHALGGGIIADGGIRTPGDAAKALGANADLVMIGGMFAGTAEQDGEVTEKSFLTDQIGWVDGRQQPIYINKQFKTFYGMSSEHAQKKHNAGMKTYRASEGTVSEVEYIGPVSNKIQELLGGLRSTGTYIGAKHIKDFGKCTTFIRVNKVHDRNV